NKNVILASLFLVFSIIILVCGIILIMKTENYVWVWGILAFLASGLGIAFSLILISKHYWTRNAIVKKSFNYFMDEVISHNSLGLIVYDHKNYILWTSAFFKNRFGRNWIGETLNNFFEDYSIYFEIGQQNFSFEFQGFTYEATIWPLKNCISIKDVTFEKQLEKIYRDQLSVIGEMEIDNYQLYNSILSEEEIYKVNQEFISILDELVVNYNFTYRQYTSGKFIIFTNKESIDKMSKINFSFLSRIHNVLSESKTNNILVSVSAGFAVGFKNLWEKTEQAKSALLQAQSRGGDQVAIFSKNENPKYFGSSSEILYDISRTKIKSLANNIEQKLKSPKIKKVICYGHANADLDAIGASLGIWTLAKQFNKEAYICSTTQDSTTSKAIEKLIPDAEYDEIFIKPQAANKITDDQTLVFLLDNSDIKRTDNKDCITNTKVNNIFILDHHRLGSSVDFCPKMNRYIDSAASSTSEIVTEILMFVQKKIKLQHFISQMLLNGIYLDTLQFTKHVSSRTFSAAAWLEERGADSSKSSESLKMDASTWEQINDLLMNIQEVKPYYYLAYKDVALSNDVISIAAEEILKISGRKAAFVVAKLKGTNIYKMSARGLGVNVQLIAEAVGGGGHYGTAAATTIEDFETFINNIKHAIVSEKNESNTY
ncbi:DHH family phosphoesterase, partial [Mycoplasma tauri]